MGFHRRNPLPGCARTPGRDRRLDRGGAGRPGDPGLDDRRRPHPDARGRAVNGAHDMGGMHGLGPIVPEADEPVFHAPWEGRIFALTSIGFGWRRWTVDAWRHQHEKIPGADYLRMSYYEKWATSLAELAVTAGLATRSEVEP